MITIIDEELNEVVTRHEGMEMRYPLSSPEGFAAASRAWIRAGWDTKYVYSFSWLGRPIIQLPDDLLRIQEVVYAVKPDVLVETGVAHGGSLIFYASLFKSMGRGRVIGVDIDIRPHNRRAIESHELASYISLIEGSSIDSTIISKVRASLQSGDRVLVVLDSGHSYKHVRAELEAYAPLVSVGSYIVATDGIMKQVAGAPRSRPEWVVDNPLRAARDFVAANPNYIIEEPVWPFNEGVVTQRVTYWPDGFIRRRS